MNSRFCRSFVADVSASALIDSPPHIPVRHSVRLYYGSTVERVDICVVVVLRMESRLQVVCDRQDLKARPVSKNRGQGLSDTRPNHLKCASFASWLKIASKMLKEPRPSRLPECLASKLDFSLRPFASSSLFILLPLSVSPLPPSFVLSLVLCPPMPYSTDTIVFFFSSHCGYDNKRRVVSNLYLRRSQLSMEILLCVGSRSLDVPWLCLFSLIVRHASML
ncbi:hypothetical protein C8R45DRAFT_1215114 [Mycena sanguinolenta]|nr:hypothetical protein C8R45DRAFT_1215114 [Mycena sanguinolenta]